MPSITQSFRCFDEVARQGSLRKAAEVLHLSGPTIHQQIVNFEELVGTPMFERLPRGMRLTSAGEIMIATVRRCQRDFDQSLLQIEDLRTLRRGHVSIGVPPSSAEHLLPGVVETVLQRHPGLSFSIKSGNGESLLRGVANGEIDVAYCLRRSPPPGVGEVRAWAQHLGVVARPGHALFAQARPLRMRDCLNHPLILLAPDMELRMLTDRMEARHQRQVRPLVETGSVAMALRLASQSDAVAFLLPDNVTEEVDAGRLKWVGLEDAGARVHSCLYQRVGYTTPVAMGAFLSALEAAIDSIRVRFDGQPLDTGAVTDSE